MRHNASGTNIGNYRWTICGLLFFATTINYLDRQVLSLLAPSLSKEFGWSNTDYANIAAAFQLVYAVALLFAGRVVDRIGTRRAYHLAIFIWSLGAIAHAYSLAIGNAVNSVFAAIGLAAVPASVAGFIVSRAILAIGEAGNFPAAIKATAEFFPKTERSFATGIFNSGANIGAILAPISVPVIASIWGWEAAFMWIGAIGFLWMAFWGGYYEEPGKGHRLGKAELAYINHDAEVPDEACVDPQARKATWGELLRCRQTWAFAFGKFMTDGIWWFFLFWLPKYLSSAYGMTGTALSFPLTVLYSMTMVGSIGGGWLPKYFIARGRSVYDARMKAMLLIAFCPLVVLLAEPLGSMGYWIPVILIGIGASAHQAWSANLFTTASDWFPKNAVGSVVGIGGLAGGIGGVLVTKLGGALFDHYGALGEIQTGYLIMFAICATAYLAAWVVMKLLVPVHKMAELPKGLQNA
ncbi:Hexuronate transporter [Massilia sp. Bi118]|uniref:MFS transporter n=1 Tax=Massilia sp. Bi118 TaxID=2822346 RepID=UPI001D8FAA95|nr:MFS transporter [Massilia sp. Bi118]CAH0274540.1 Hexuronate transporter [Massilia sp. Bi118]